MPLKIKRLQFNDFLALEDDANFPGRAEKLGSMDIDDHKAVLRECDIRPGMTVIDIGAFIGDTAYVFADWGCKVAAMEPFFDAFVCLVYNTRGWPVRYWNVAVGNGEKVKLIDEGIGGNLGMRRVIKADDGVPTVKIDDLNLAPDFMKIDCEGFEVPALLGARATIAKHRPILFVEMYKDGLERTGYTPQHLSDTITALGYSMKMWGSEPRWDWLCRPL